MTMPTAASPCGKCGAAQLRTAKYCRRCGSDLREQQNAIDWSRESGNGELSVEQAAAVAAPNDTNVLVTARAGSGKTRVLVSRALFLQHQRDVRPEQILVLAFNKKAVEEIQDRLSKYVGEKQPHVMTFHALAYRLVRPKQRILVDNRVSEARELTREIESKRQGTETSRNKDVRPPTPTQKNEVARLARSPSLISRLINFALSPFVVIWKKIASGELDLRAEAEAVEAREQQQQPGIILKGDKTSLDGTYVKSNPETLISNILFLYDIPYTYEKYFPWGKGYFPDFAITTQEKPVEAGVIIEYFGLLNHPAYPKYSQEAEEKRKYWQQDPNWVLIELTENDFARGQEEFTASLLRKLKEHGVKWKKLSPEEIQRRKPKEVSASEFTEAMVTFINNCRARRLTSDELRDSVSQHLPHVIDEQEKRFLGLVEPIYAMYLEELARNTYEDFNGVLWKSVDRVHAGKATFSQPAASEEGDIEKLRFVLIDEFQDFNQTFYAISQSIQEVNPDTRFFCVGDDWQSINSFAGSDSKFFRQFSDYFEQTDVYWLTDNYRSDVSIVRASNRLMSGNGVAARGGVPVTDRIGEAKLWALEQFQMRWPEKHRQGSDRFLAAVLRLIQSQLESKRDVVLLSRTNHDPAGKPLQDLLADVHKALRKEHRKHVTVSTTHSYKGEESATVILIDVLDSKYPLIHPHWKFERIFGKTEADIVEEERRLFYVALTRAQNSLHIVTETRTPLVGRKIEPSRFLEGIVDEFESTCWDEIKSIRALPGQELIQIRITGKTFDVKDDLGGNGFRWEQEEQYWYKVFLARDIKRNNFPMFEPWIHPGLTIRFVNEDEEVIHEIET